MIPAPQHVSQQNTYRLVHERHDADARDIDRIEDLLADAIHAAREALHAMADLPYEMLRPCDTWRRTLSDHVGRRRLLTEDFRADAEEVLRELARADVFDDNARAHDTALRRLRDAVNLSNRVADLLAAERDIGWHRGIRD